MAPAGGSRENGRSHVRPGHPAPPATGPPRATRSATHRSGGIPHDRAFGNGHLQVGAGLAVAGLAHPVAAVSGPAVGMVAKSEQRGHVAVGDQADVAAGSAVATVRSALGDVRLPPK